MEQEANEKANEINVKAEENFNIIKARIVQKEKQRIMASYDKKMKLIETNRKIEMSSQHNKSRIEVLNAQDKALEEIFEAARARLTAVSSDAGAYGALLEQMIKEGLYAMVDEADLSVWCRKADKAAVEAAAKKAAAAYKSETKRAVKLTVDKDNPLAAGCAGGVELVAMGGKIRIDNTLEARVESAFNA